MSRRTPAVLISPVVAFVAAVAGTSPARADDTLDENNVLGRTDLVVASATGGFDVCFSGSVWTAARLTGSWTVTIGGTSLTAPIIVRGSGATISGCRFATKAAMPAGQVAVTFSYVGAATAISTSFLAGSVGSATWAPLVGNVPLSVDINQ